MTATEHQSSLDLVAGAVVDLRSIDPADADSSDLAPLAELVRDARVVGLGESVHHMHEFYLARHRVLRFLVEQLGFTAVCLESGLVEGLAVDAWLQGADTNLDSLLTLGFTNGMGACEEFRDQLEWMRGHRGVRYFGIDATDDLAAALAPLVSFLDAVDQPMADHVRAELLPLVAQWDYRAADGYVGPMQRYDQMGQVARDRLATQLAHLELVLDDRRVTYTARSSRKQAAEALWRARIARQLEAVFRNWSAGGYFEAASNSTLSRNARDLFMSRNVEQVLGELGPDARVVVVAHNAHLARYPLALTDGPALDDGATVLGQYLDHRFGQGYVPIALTSRTGLLPAGTTFAQSETALGDPAPGSLEALLSTHGHRPFIADLRTWPATGDLSSATQMRLSERYASIDPAKAFDLVLHVDEVSAYRALSPSGG